MNTQVAGVFSVESQCGTKRQFKTKHEAKKSLSRHRNDGKKFDIYRCPHCRFIHLATGYRG